LLTHRTEHQEQHVITVEYLLVDPSDLPDDADFDVIEDRGQIVIKIGRHLTADQIVSGLNEVSAAILAGGHWFQEWKGDIISVELQPSLHNVPPQRRLYDVNKPESGAA